MEERTSGPAGAAGLRRSKKPRESEEEEQPTPPPQPPKSPGRASRASLGRLTSPPGDGPPPTTGAEADVVDMTKLADRIAAAELRLMDFSQLESQQDEMAQALKVLQEDGESLEQLGEAIKAVRACRKLLDLVEENGGLDALKEALQRKKTERDAAPDGLFSSSRRWMFRAFQPLAESLILLVEKAWDNKEFVMFASHGYEQLTDVPPLANRFAAIRSFHATKSAYLRLLELIKTKATPKEDSIEDMVLRELVAIYFVSRDNLSFLPLRSYLVALSTRRESLSLISEEALKSNEIDSIISSHLRSTVRNSSWYLALGVELGDGMLTGEDVKSSLHYRRTIEAARAATPLTQHLLQTRNLEGSVASGYHQSVSVAGGQPAYAHTGSMAAPQPRAQARQNTHQKGARPPGRQPFGVTGHILVGDRCGQCGKQGHRASTCRKPHPLFDTKLPWSLLQDMSVGKIPLPGPNE